MVIDSNYFYPIGIAAGVVGVAIIGKRAGWFKIISGTNALLKEQNEALRGNEILLREQLAALKSQLQSSTAQHEQDKKDWNDRHNESLTEIAKLQGKVDTLTALPLDKIDNTLKEFNTLGSKFVESNDKIVQLLQDKALIDAQDREVLTKIKD